jgi:protein SCO1/2
MGLTTRLRRAAVVGAVLAVAAGALAWGLVRTGYLGGDTGGLPPGQSLEVAQIEVLARVPDFSLAGGAGTFTQADLKGRWSFVFFGYTNCPDACPATLGILNHVQESLRAQGVQPPRIVFISLDPERDTPLVLSRYAAAFGADTIGLGGDAAALQDLLTFFGVRFERKPVESKPGTDAAAYTLDHTTNFFLVRPDGRWLATFAPADDGDAVLADTRTLMRVP